MKDGGGKTIAIVCHWSRRASESSIESERTFISSGRRRPCAKIWATYPPWPYAQVLRALALGNSNSTLFYHPKKPFYHYTIACYNISSISNFYFPILFIKIIYLHNKIIYPQTQIKTKTQIPTCYHHRHKQPNPPLCSFPFSFHALINHMLPKLFENKKNLTILSQRDLAKVPSNITSIRRTPSLRINPSPITDHQSQTHHRSPIPNPSLITDPSTHQQPHHRSNPPITDPKPITNHLSQTYHTDHQSINPSTTTTLIKPIDHQSQTHHRSSIHQPITDHRSINPSTATSPIKPINPTNPSAPIKNQTLHHPPPNPATTKQTHYNTS